MNTAKFIGYYYRQAKNGWEVGEIRERNKQRDYFVLATFATLDEAQAACTQMHTQRETTQQQSPINPRNLVYPTQSKHKHLSS